MNSSGLSQGTLSLTVEPNGAFFYPTVKLLDLRLAKSVRLSENWGKVEGIFDVFNVNNSSAILSVNNQSGRGCTWPHIRPSAANTESPHRSSRRTVDILVCGSEIDSA